MLLIMNLDMQFMAEDYKEVLKKVNKVSIVPRGLAALGYTLKYSRGE